MGSTPSKAAASVEDISSSDLAAYVASLGNNFKAYEETLRNSGIRGEDLVGMTDAELDSVLDSLNVVNRLHRRKLASVCKKMLKAGSEGGECDTCSTTSSSYSNISPRQQRNPGGGSLYEAPSLERYSSGCSFASSCADDSVCSMSMANNDSCSGAFSVADAAPLPGPFENMCVENSAEALSLLVSMENQKRLLRQSDKPQGPPEGEAAIVLTDVQGSTALWEADPKAMRTALNMHDDIIRALRADAGGYEIDTEGDAFFMAFHSAKDALTFALRFQDDLRDANWNDDILAHPEASVCTQTGKRGLRVRIGIHMGPVTTRPNAVTGRLEYTGETMDRAREVESMANGGQILTTRSTWKIASDVDQGGIAAQIDDRGNGVVQVLSAERPCSLRTSLSAGSMVDSMSDTKILSGGISVASCHGRRRRDSLRKSFSKGTLERPRRSSRSKRRPPQRSASMDASSVAASSSAALQACS